MTFIRSLVEEVSRQGAKCSVIAPQSLSRAVVRRLPIRPRFWIDSFDGGITAEVYQPYTFSFSKAGKKLVEKLNTVLVNQTFKSIKQPVDVLYGHFWRMGIRAAQLDVDLPLFVACGESVIPENFSLNLIKQMERKLKGVIYVSRDCLEESKRKGFQKDTDYIIAPNGYDPSVFKPMDKSVCRKQLGWNKDDFIVSFLGSFNDRKGVNRLSEAIRLANKKERISACFIGNGSIKPDCPNIVFCGTLDHDMIPAYLCASDVFVLPTLHEGCCNAIVEALACGIPVISSDLPFNDELLDQSCSIRTDPTDIQQIVNSILKLKQDESLRERLHLGALKKAEKLEIGERTRRILSFINTHI